MSKSKLHNHFSVLSFGLLLLLVAGCAKQVRLTPSSYTPAAMGTAKLTEDKNGNTVVNLKVEHLAQPSSLSPPRATYVVWIQAPGGSAVNQGQLQVDSDLKGEFRSPTSYKTFDLFVTAEDSASVTYPGDTKVLWQTVSR